jgi:hypothetical protein
MLTWLQQPSNPHGYLERCFLGIRPSYGLVLPSHPDGPEH